MASQGECDPDTAGSHDLPGVPGGSWYTWWSGDPLPTLPALPGFMASRVDDDSPFARIGAAEVAEARAHIRAGNRLYLARLGAASVGYGWCATEAASIGELRLSFTLPARNRYLWGFVTLAEWRGRGIYPQLLRAILAAELGAADRFWIGHEPGNVASSRGILKAGFRRVGDIYFLPGGGLGLLADGAPERGSAAAAVLGVRQLALG